ncbi:hypothetical protein [Hartmannibacter diazotrophicus]|uniref:hypothetical protein n=1 Tax=Hartmannibacter diazotrophicus TaxID=1482074 RepID=UPI0012FDFEBE|nr:hypothetical protein [Hartmannibacter diazotrophicus]
MRNRLATAGVRSRQTSRGKPGHDGHAPPQATTGLPTLDLSMARPAAWHDPSATVRMVGFGLPSPELMAAVFGLLVPCRRCLLSALGLFMQAIMPLLERLFNSESVEGRDNFQAHLGPKCPRNGLSAQILVFCPGAGGFPASADFRRLRPAVKCVLYDHSIDLVEADSCLNGRTMRPDRTRRGV